jgi:hypothetical protein
MDNLHRCICLCDIAKYREGADAVLTAVVGFLFPDNESGQGGVVDHLL